MTKEQALEILRRAKEDSEKPSHKELMQAIKVISDSVLQKPSE